MPRVRGTTLPQGGHSFHVPTLSSITLREDDPSIHGLFPDHLEMANKGQPGEEVRCTIHGAPDKQTSSFPE